MAKTKTPIGFAATEIKNDLMKTPEFSFFDPSALLSILMTLITIIFKGCQTTEGDLSASAVKSRVMRHWRAKKKDWASGIVKRVQEQALETAEEEGAPITRDQAKVLAISSLNQIRTNQEARIGDVVMQSID